ncbi:MAG: cation-translocating P-type ATPase [Chloroflexota bacterium]
MNQSTRPPRTQTTSRPDEPRLARNRPPYTITAEAVADGLGVQPALGLSHQEAAARLEQDGPNVLNVQPPPTLLVLVARQFKSAIVLLLVVAAIISLLAGDAKDAIAIIAILILNAIIGAYQEARAENALASLREMTPARARCRRGGATVDLLARELVRGDTVLIRSGDIVPADGRLVSIVSLSVDESSLTGESVAVEKDPAVLAEPDALPGDRLNMVFQGTAVTAGHGEMVVTATAMQTEMGQIAASLAESAPPQTPLERQVAWLTRFLSILAVGAAGAVFALGLVRGDPLEQLFLVALSLAVAAVPEGLPAVVTIVLALGVQRMARRHAIVRRLASVEALGSATVICTDKTGTLTLGEMRVTAVVVGDRQVDVSGSRLSADGAPVSTEQVDGLTDLVTAAVLCNNAQDGSESAGDPTERALVHLATDLAVDLPALGAAAPRAFEIPFDSVRKRMTTIHNGHNGASNGVAASMLPEATEPASCIAFTKGAPDMVLPLCTRWLTATGEQPLSEADHAAIRDRLEALAGQGLRMLAVARRAVSADTAPTPSDGFAEQVESDLTLLGLLGLMDPLRTEVQAALADAHAAGIRTIMITGDHPITALAIGKQLGLGDGRVLTGLELQQLDADGLERIAGDLAICARVAPQQKVEIVRALQATGEVVGMTGDGSNDAPALRLADIGVAMGIRGTAVSKEAAAIVLTDDNYATIVSAIEEGRTIYANLRKTILYLVSGNVGEVLTILLAMLFGLPLPFQAIQILWINLVTDALPAIGLAMEPAESGVMRRPPRARGESFLPGWIMPLIGVPSVLLAAVSLLAFVVTLARYPGDLAIAQSTALLTLISAHLLMGWSQRSTLGVSLTLPFRSNPILLLAIVMGIGSLLPILYTGIGRDWFHTAAIDLDGWLLAMALAPVPLLGAELVKLVVRRRHVPPNTR